ncbi:MAG TPA: DNA polymerase III subunit beta [Candidatus Moranbacteria bacterium]|nr:DNA polymerase III subunit beta [Candidatus Moranbacteria bacterium]
MKLICTQENFKKAILTVDKITSKQTTLPILKNILLETKDGRLVFSATNLEIGIINKIGAKIEKEGKIAVPVKLISNFILNLPFEESIEIELKGQILHINCGKYKAKINCLDSEDFPIIPSKKEEAQFKLKNNKFKKIIENSLNCVSLNDTRVEFTGVNVNFEDKIYFASTDSFRLAENVIDIKKDEKYNILKGKSIIIPAETLRELNKILSNIEENVDIFITIEENQIFFDINDIKVVSRLINGNYPDYKQIIPNKFKTNILISKKELLQSIKIASIFTKNNEGEVDIKIKSEENDKMIIKSELQEAGENKVELNIDKSGDDQRFVINPRFLIDGLNSISTEKVKIMINDSISPIGLKNVNKENKDEDSYIYIIMPIKK